jgi:hypothetical protein
MSNLFPGSATRTVEDINESDIKHQDNINETLEEKNTNVNNNVIETLTEQKQDDNKTETKQTVNDVIENDDVLGFLNTNKKKTLVGFHLEDDINKVIKKVLGKNPGKGAQSELANRIFRDFFEKRGLL